MSTINFFICLLCVSLVSLGQVLIRLSAARIVANPNWLGALIAGPTLLAVCIYAGAMALWFFILTRVPLTLAFPVFGLCFILVPLLAHFLAGDPVSASTWVAGLFIMIGVSIGAFVRS